MTKTTSELNIKHNGPVTILDVAKVANVSHTTVSRALRGNKSVKNSTRERIIKIANDMGYVPNKSAQQLVTSHSNILGIFFTNIETGTSSSFLTEVIEQVQRQIPNSFSINIDNISSINNNPSYLIQDYAGIIIISQSESDYPYIKTILDSKVPAVILNRKISSNLLDNFAIDDYHGSFAITEYAIRMGHRNFALITGLDSFTSSKLRTDGFKDALTKHKIDPNKVIIKHGDYRPRSGNQLMRQILSTGPIPSCVICQNDDMAVGALSACSELGYRVPKDISIVGFDDMNYSKYLSPSLTTMRKPTSQIIKLGVKRLIDIINGNDSKPIQQTFAPEIIVRNSVQNLRDIDKEVH